LCASSMMIVRVRSGGPRHPGDACPQPALHIRSAHRESGSGHRSRQGRVVRPCLDLVWLAIGVAVASLSRIRVSVACRGSKRGARLTNWQATSCAAVPLILLTPMPPRPGGVAIASRPYASHGPDRARAATADMWSRTTSSTSYTRTTPATSGLRSAARCRTMRHAGKRCGGLGGRWCGDLTYGRRAVSISDRADSTHLRSRPPRRGLSPVPSLSLGLRVFPAVQVCSSCCA
jgi:hypothetical protein